MADSIVKQSPALAGGLVRILSHGTRNCIAISGQATRNVPLCAVRAGADSPCICKITTEEE